MFKRKQKQKNSLGTMELRIYKYWQALFMSLYSGKLYIDVAKRWRGIGLMYCLTLLLFASIPYVVKSMISFNHYVNDNMLVPISKIPEFKMVGGQVQFNHDMPYFIKNSSGEVAIIIDTTNHINEISDKYPDLFMLINKKKYHFRDPTMNFLKHDIKNQKYYKEQTIDSYDLSKSDNVTFNANSWLEETKFSKLKNICLAAFYPLSVSAFFGIFSVMLIVFSMMGQVASYAIFKHKLLFKQACRLMMVSSTIAVATYLNLKVVDINNFEASFFCMSLAFIYFSYAVLCVRRDSRKLVHF